MQTPSQGGLPLDTLVAQITEQANLVRTKKEQGVGEDELQPLILTLMQLKVDLTDQVGVGGHELALSKSAYKKEKKHLEEAKTVKKEKQQFKEGEGRNAKLAKKMLEEREKAQLVNNTPPGEKKDVSEEMAKAYEPASVESAWYSWWEKCGFFRPRDDDENSERFVIVIPPPNVTGSLHLGHALTCSIQDSLVRWHRMLGHNTLYVPGTDHAGIATQVVVEKQLKKESGVTRHQLGREEFLKKVWEWKEARGGHITKQLRLTGASVDWTREAFTMDEKRSAAVKEAFCRLYERGLIYRDTKLTDWSCALQSVISKIEIENVELTGETKLNVPGYDKKIDFGFLFDFAYPIDGSEGEFIVVSTTRPETMLGDTAVAIHPEDPRYKHLHGKYVKHPFVDRKFPIICDPTLVDMNFGTGAVKVTPAHDPNDFACGKRHNLEVIDIMTDAGLMNGNCGEFSGMKRFDARTAVMKKLEEMKLFRGRKPNAMTIPTCSRTGDVLEPRVKPQWYCDCKNMAQRSVKAVETGDLRILPKSHETVWNHWLNNIQDWCISRQLWWGHRIPAYYVDFEGEAKGERNINERWVVGRTEDEARNLAAKKFGKDPSAIILTQDEDVLDTWFSSGLFPFSTMGWPEQTNDLKMFYPGQLLETGYDILFFWVARMVMFGLELTDQLPFKDVFLHTIVRDKYGRKMSKSLGNVIDPLWVVDGITLSELHTNVASGNLDPREVNSAQKAQSDQFPEGIAPCGSDGLRFALLNNTTQGADINLDINGVVSCRNFCNKIWQATRMAMAHLTEFTPAATPMEGYNATPLVVKWILSRLNHAIAEVNESFKTYDFHQVTVASRVFFWEELCDVFLEFSKPILHEPNHPYLAATREALYTCLEVSFRLLHPTLPFLTEELWQRLPKRPNENAPSIMVSKFPQPVPEWNNPEAEANLEMVLHVARAMRSTKASYQLAPKSAPKTVVRVRTEEQRALVLEHTIDFQRNCGVGEVESVIGGDAPKGYGMTTATPDIDVFLALAGNVDAAAEIAKLQKEILKLEAQRDKINAERADTVKYEKKPEQKRKDDLERLEKLEQEIVQKKKDIVTFESLA